MIQVRDTLHIWFANIEGAVSHFHRLLPAIPADFFAGGLRCQRLTDLCGPMYTLPEALSLPAIPTWEDGQQALSARPECGPWCKGLDVIGRGRRARVCARRAGQHRLARSGRDHRAQPFPSAGVEGAC